MTRTLASWLTIDASGRIAIDSHAASADRRVSLANTRTLGVLLRLMLLEATAPGLPLEERRRSALRGVPRGMREDVAEWAFGVLEARAHA